MPKANKDKAEEPVKIDKRAAIEKFIKTAKKQHSDVMDIDFASDADLDYGFLIPPIPSLANLLGRDDGTPGGFPRGKFTVVAGPERSGKTTLCLQTIGHEMRQDPESYFVWVDTENSFDADYAEKLDVDLNRLIIIKNGNMEDVLNRIMEMKDIAQFITGIVIDSVGGLVPHEEMEDKHGNKVGLEKDQMLNLQRRLPKFLRITNITTGKHQISIVLISHVYTDVGGYGGYVVKGGNGLKHWGHLRLMISRANDHGTKEKITMPDGNTKEVFTGHDVIVKLEKTRQNSKENQSVVIPYRYGIGLDAVESTISVAINLGIIERAGAWYTCGTERLQGRKNLVKYLNENPEVYSQVINDITVHYEVKKDKTKEEPAVSEENIDESIA